MSRTMLAGRQTKFRRVGFIEGDGTFGFVDPSKIVRSSTSVAVASIDHPM
jgi:hypothetical protein